MTSKLAQLAINDQGFVFDPLSGTSYVINETGRVVLDGLLHHAQKMLAIYPVDKYFLNEYALLIMKERPEAAKEAFATVLLLEPENTVAKQMMKQF